MGKVFNVKNSPMIASGYSVIYVPFGCTMFTTVFRGDFQSRRSCLP